MKAPSPHITETDAKAGLIAGVIAYTIWGFFPIYFKITQEVGALEILAHRIVWSVPFGLLIILARRQWPEVKAALKNRKMLALLTLAAIALSINWGFYIWAIQIDQIFQASLGYYINPLMYVLVGVFFFGEYLSKFQVFAVVLAFIGVMILGIFGGVIPYISIVLVISWTLYGVIRKYVDIGGMPGLFVETLVLMPPAVVYLIWLSQTGDMIFINSGTGMTALLLFAGPMTVIPLLAFAIAARRLKLSTLGFLQYIGPTLQFACAIYYGEVLTTAHAWCFGFIWAAVAIFMWDGFRRRPVPV